MLRSRHLSNSKFLLFASSLFGAGALALFLLLGDLPAPNALLTRASPDTTKIYDRNGQLLFEVLDPRAGRRTRVPLNELPVSFQKAVIAVEDANYYQHPGVDVVGVARAVAQAILNGQVMGGGSTITQQLARDVLLSQEERESRTLTRKLREMTLAVRLTQAYPKDTILEMYLNEVYFGQLAYGAEAAAQAYFGKPARDLDLAESAMLAGLIQSPAAHNPLVDFDAGKARQKVVLGLMVKNGFVSEAQANLAASEALHFAAPETTTGSLRAPHFVTYVRNLLESLYGAEAVNHGGLRVVTTLDLNLNDRAEAIIRQKLGELQRRTREEGAPDYNIHDAALVALDPATGEILAMVGSAGYYNAAIEGAVNVALSNRQPGSAIKPITYATAFERGFTPASVFSDVPTTFQTRENEPYAPQNYDRAWHGPISLRRALATSSNMVAVKVLDSIGVPSMIATAKRLGITTFDDPDRFGLALTLGGGEVKLLELTAAFGAFANEGRPVSPTAILTVNGVRTSANASAGAQGVSPQIAFLITSILSDNSARLNAFGEDNVLTLDRPAAAKTGTTSDFRDNWTVGYTPDLAVGVWAGNANNDPMYKISGITGAAPIWHDFMEETLANRAPRPFPVPDGIVQADVCENSGLLATDDCGRIHSEYFIAGTEPTKKDDSYRSIALDGATGLLWADGCQGPRVSRVYRLLPFDALDWGIKQGIPQPPDETCQGEHVAPLTYASGAAMGNGQISASVLTGGNSGQVAQAAGAPAPLVITDPAQNSVWALSAQLPLAMQLIELTARPNTASRLKDIVLWVDDLPVARFDRTPIRALWPLILGEHQVRVTAVNDAGETVSSPPVTFRVENESKP